VVKAQEAQELQVVKVRRHLLQVLFMLAAVAALRITQPVGMEDRAVAAMDLIKVYQVVAEPNLPVAVLAEGAIRGVVASLLCVF
jgi:hypothetical protein